MYGQQRCALFVGNKTIMFIIDTGFVEVRISILTQSLHFRMCWITCIPAHSSNLTLYKKIPYGLRKFWGCLKIQTLTKRTDERAKFRDYWIDLECYSVFNSSFIAGMLK